MVLRTLRTLRTVISSYPIQFKLIFSKYPSTVRVSDRLQRSNSWYSVPAMTFFVISALIYYAVFTSKYWNLEKLYSNTNKNTLSKTSQQKLIFKWGKLDNIIQWKKFHWIGFLKSYISLKNIKIKRFLIFNRFREFITLWQSTRDCLIKKGNILQSKMCQVGNSKSLAQSEQINPVHSDFICKVNTDWSQSSSLINITSISVLLTVSSETSRAVYFSLLLRGKADKGSFSYF